MRSKLLFFSCAAVAAVAVGFFATPARSQLGVAKNYVQLQSSSPGSAQSGNASIAGTMVADKFIGQGANLTNLNASALNSGTVPDARLSTNIPRLATPNTFLANNLFNASVGIGTATPGSALEVVGSAKFTAASAITAVTMISYTTSPAVRIDNSGSGQGLRVESMGQGIFVTSGGNVGLRATSSVLTGIEGVGALNGVRGDGANFGVQGVANVVGVFGQGSTGVRGNGNAFGVFSEGNLGASGTKSFVIDHPFDPENQYLVHYSHEGPEPRNVYQGKVETDEKGLAWVQMPDYYDAINRDPLIQLTVVDESDDFVQVKVARRLTDGRFQIRTSKPGVEVNWRVDAIRNDAWVRERGAAVEKPKLGAERGRYLHPELFGQPTSKAMTSVERGAPRKP